MTEFYWATNKKTRTRTCKGCAEDRQKERKTLKKETYSYLAHLRHLRVTYGLSKEEYCRLMDMQGGRCAICNILITARENAQVDHDHETGRIRGILCFCCNTAIGKFRDSVDMMLLAIEYLRKEPPVLQLRSKELSAEERKHNRSDAVQRWHDSDYGKTVTKARAIHQSGENNMVSRLSDKQRIDIAIRYNAGGLSQQDLATEYGVSQGAIARIMKKDREGK